VRKGYTCGGGGNIDYYISIVLSYSFRVTKMRLIGDEWIATKLEGIHDEDGTRGCGLEGAAHARYALRAALSGRG
jgi:hypothetical protein